MPDLVTVNRIASMLDAITSDRDLKLISRELNRRAMKLEALRAAGFKQGDRVCCRRRGRTVHGVVESIERANVIVKMDHGLVARMPARELSLSPAVLRRLSA